MGGVIVERRGNYRARDHTRRGDSRGKDNYIARDTTQEMVTRKCPKSLPAHISILAP